MSWPAAIDEAREVENETRQDDDAPVHRTTIWAVVDDGDGLVLNYPDMAERVHP